MTEIPVRDTFWNIPAWAVVGVYLGGAIAVAVFAWGLYRRIQLWRRGGPEMRRDHVPRRLAKVIREVLLQARILSQPYPGIMHAALFWSFLALFTGTAIATLDWEITRLLFDFRVLRGSFYLLFELTLDLAGLFLLLGLGLAVWRRFVKRPKRTEPAGKFAYALAVLFVITLTGFLMEGARLAATQPGWGPWSPVGWAIGRALLAAGTGEDALRGLHLSLWLTHALIVFAFIALIPRSYFVHLVATPLNIFFSRLGPRGALGKIENLEEQESFGVSRFEQFSWKRRLDFDACVECGRCHDICCAQQTGGVLSPKRVMVKLKRYMLDGDSRPLHGEIITPGELWACTTCAACARECPAHLDIVDTLVELRRHLGMELGAFPASVAQTLRHIERAGNPWGLDPGERLAWARGLDLPLMELGKGVEYLYWVGCSAAYDPGNQKIARSLVAILKHAGVSFGVMAEERCHAEVARRLGEEYLYQTAAAENIAKLGKYAFKKILTHCPHCFNTLKHEYPQFDRGKFEVIHHAELIAELLRAGRLPAAASGSGRVAFHDPCYLGRYNGILEPPRKVIAIATGAAAGEFPFRGERSMCCGAGGGRMWMEEDAGSRINVKRVRQVLDQKPQVIATACPYCKTMMADGIAQLGKSDAMQARDIAELVAAGLAQTQKEQRA
jgi:Fe-S oxidoreductase/nitrate reductase gamma subunit